MVEGGLTNRYGMKLQGETCAKITILPGMMRRFNQNMYHKQLCEKAGPQGETLVRRKKTMRLFKSYRT